MICSERGASLSPNSVRNWFADLYAQLGFDGCSSHSGRRTFITSAAKKIVAAGGTLVELNPLIDSFQHLYNHYRPHGALQGLTPAQYLAAHHSLEPPPSHMS